jgi:hypothetical protein
VLVHLASEGGEVISLLDMTITAEHSSNHAITERRAIGIVRESRVVSREDGRFVSPRFSANASKPSAAAFCASDLRNGQRRALMSRRPV